MKDIRGFAERRWRTIEPGIRKDVTERMAARDYGVSIDYMVAINATQNVIKEAIVGATNAAMPQPEVFFIELAVRLCCYPLTALPPDLQEQAALLVKDRILDKLADMQAAGAAIGADWT